MARKQNSAEKLVQQQVQLIAFPNKNLLQKKPKK